MYYILKPYSAQIGAFLGVVLAFSMLRHTTLTLWLAIPIGIAVIYATVLLVSFAIEKLRG